MTDDRTRQLASGQDTPDHAERYESLRAYAVQRCAPASRDGLVVLLRQGVAAWMETWSRMPAPVAPLVRSERQRSSLLSDDASAEVVRLLVAMTLSHVQEVHS